MEATSSDGIVTAVTDPANLGVLLRVVKTGGATATVWRVQDGQAARVRSGDSVLLINGQGFAYDHEVDPDFPAAYYAVVDGAQSASAVVTLAWPQTCTAWLKNPVTPSDSMRVRVMRGWQAGSGFGGSVVGYASPPPGQVAYPWATAGAQYAETGTGTLRVYDKPTYDRLQRMLRAQTPLLLQTSPGYGLEDLWFLPTRVDWNRPGDATGWTRRDAVIGWTQMARPATEGWPLLMPRWSWEQAQVGGPYADVWALLTAGIGA